MKKALLMAFVTLIMFMSISLTGCSNKSVSLYDAEILDTAKEVTSLLRFNLKSENPFLTTNRQFTVEKNDEDGRFYIDVNGTNMIIENSNNKEEGAFVPKNIKEISMECWKTVISSKKKILKYIEDSTVLKDKQGIKKYIENLPVKYASYTGDMETGAYFSDADSVVYVNENVKDYVCEWMIVHEYVHAISFYTHGKIFKNEEFCYNMFNEIITDIITSSLNPKLSEEVMSGYAFMYYLVYPYINLVAEEAINAYFYGYDNIYKKINNDEFEFFVIVIENIEEDNAEVYYNNLIYKWYAEIN